MDDVALPSVGWCGGSEARLRRKGRIDSLHSPVHPGSLQHYDCRSGGWRRCRRSGDSRPRRIGQPNDLRKTCFSINIKKITFIFF
jgi:hypothetical protein